jgi:hypothetical protein
VVAAIFRGSYRLLFQLRPTLHNQIKKYFQLVMDFSESLFNNGTLIGTIIMDWVSMTPEKEI